MKPQLAIDTRWVSPLQGNSGHLTLARDQQREHAVADDNAHLRTRAAQHHDSQITDLAT
ncbi:hypothetical protein ACQP2U_42400 (plasmid) [Nocardia sp. CA-084685]|uniref:hypothetical protein n=1 Tax=Nocardia sp. CA-084685 TaxID=3239970 RepID=UPI003D957DEA